ncbi:hypothetical protein ACFL2Z_03740 [Candidatus Eisenbacteria bacterium]|uniref:DUF7507 domain-containing protein n=1 Tax=Eiseniibacteriota bacterium TaxID=2212470 RepID=A0ABV6YPK7_UNCEI
MSILKLLVLGAMVLALTPVLALAETPPGCGGVGLDETLLPSGIYFHVGEQICYEAWLAINAPKCDMQDVEVRFWRPDDVPPNPLNICGSPGGNTLVSGLYISQGAAPIILDCASYPALDYTVQAEDIVIVEDIPAVVAYVCITGSQLVGPPSQPGQDAKAIPNFVLAPCIGVTKEACEYSKEGDEITYSICVKNCSDVAIPGGPVIPTTLYNVVVNDPMLGGDLAGFPSELAPGQEVCLDFPYTVTSGDMSPLENTVTASGEDFTGFEVIDTATESVTLLDPAINVIVECQGGADIGADATFLVTIENLGDVALEVTTDDARVGPYTIPAGGSQQETVTEGPMECPEICYTINIEGRIPADFCDLPNVLSDSASDCCPCICHPCIEVEKTVDCDISKVGDEVIYTIRIQNCGDIELTDVVVTDPHISGSPLAGFPSTLAVGSGWVSVDFPYTVVAGDDDGTDYPGAEMTNQAHVEATGLCGDAPEAVSDDSEVVTVYLVHPDFTVTKTCFSGPVQVGQTAEFEVYIDNIGDVPLDFTTDEAAIADFTLNPNTDFDQILTQGPATPPSECNTINVTAMIPQDGSWCDLTNSITKSSDDCCPVECNPCIEIEKSVDCDISKVGDEVIYTIRIQNCGDIDLTGVVVTDPHISDSPLDGFPTTLAVGSGWYPVDFPYTVEAGDEDPGIDFPDDIMTNMASVIADYACGDDVGTTDDDSDPVDVRLIDPSYTVDVTCQGGAEVGMDAGFDIRIDNTGDVPLVITTDDGSVDPGTILAGDFYETSVEVGPTECPEICYTLNAEGRIPSDLCDLPNVLPESDEDCCPCICTPCIEIEKIVDCDVSKVGDDVIYSIRIRNCGDTDLTGVVVTDPQISPDPLAGFPPTLAAGSGWTSADFTYTIVAGDEPGPVINTAHVVADYACGDDVGTTDDDSEPVEVNLIHPAFTVDKEHRYHH